MTAGLSESNGSLLPWDDLESPAGAHWDQLWAQRSVTNMGELYLFSVKMLVRMACICSGFEVPSCLLSTADTSRRIASCTLVFGTESTNTSTSQPAVSAVVSSHQSTAAAAAEADDDATCSVSISPPHAQLRHPLDKSQHEASAPDSVSTGYPSVAEATCPDNPSVPEAVCPGYPPLADDNVSSDFPPADLPTDTAEFRIVITHVDDYCHIYGHALQAGNTRCLSMLVFFCNLTLPYF